MIETLRAKKDTQQKVLSALLWLFSAFVLLCFCAANYSLNSKPAAHQRRRTAAQLNSRTSSFAPTWSSYSSLCYGGNYRLWFWTYTFPFYVWDEADNQIFKHLLRYIMPYHEKAINIVWLRVPSWLPNSTYLHTNTKDTAECPSAVGLLAAAPCDKATPKRKWADWHTLSCQP